MNTIKVQALFDALTSCGIIPVVVLNRAEDAQPLGGALMRGGLPVAEVTFRTTAAEEAIRSMSRSYPDMLIGAGTVLTTEQVDRAVLAGAKFIVSPGFDREVAEYCLSRDIPICPGCVTPTEVMQALKLGINYVKFFPAESMGGLKTIHAIGSPFSSVRFMPTGGINMQNVSEYLDADKVFCCGGSWMVKGDMIAAGQFELIEQKAAEAAAIVRAARGK